MQEIINAIDVRKTEALTNFENVSLPVRFLLGGGN